MQSQPNQDDLLETLCFYRGLYAMQGYRDRETAISIQAAVAYGEGPAICRCVRSSRVRTRLTGP